MLSTFSRLVTSKVYEAWIFLIRFLVSCIILHMCNISVLSEMSFHNNKISPVNVKMFKISSLKRKFV